MDALEPNCNMRNKPNRRLKLRADLLLMDMASETVRNDIVREHGDVILRARLSTRARVSRHAKDSGLATTVRQQRRNADLRSSRVAARVRNAFGPRNVRTIDQLGKAVRPVVGESIVCAQVDDDGFLLVDLVDGIDEWLAYAVGKRHDPAVDFALFSHAPDVFGAQVLVDDIALVVTL